MKAPRMRMLLMAAAACLAGAASSAAQNASLRLASPQEQMKPQANPPAAASNAANSSSSNAAPVQLTLQQAIDLARKNSTQFQTAVMNAGITRQDVLQARNALLPTVTLNNSVIYTSGVGLLNQVSPSIPPVVFIANNAVHEYVSQANVHETIDAAAIAGWRRASATAAVSRAQREIASRGLVVTVVQGYYAVESAQEKVDTAKILASEGDRFLKITQDLERGGEVAHADVIKAELQNADRHRQLQEAQLGLLNARLDFSVLIFPDFTDNFEVVDDLHAATPLPTLAEVQQQAAHDNPDVRAALAAVEEAGHDVNAARAGYLPSLTMDYFYGIDAPRFAMNTTIDGRTYSNLGSSIVGTVVIPIWNWGTTQSRIKQADLRRNQAKLELSFAHRKLLAEMQSLYSEADTALNELEGLRRSAELAKESLKLTTLRYQNGEGIILEVIDAQTTYSLANSAYQDGAVRYHVALANLQTLTGVLTTP